MGRTTPSPRMALNKEIQRLRSMAELADGEVKEALNEIIEGSLEALNLYLYADPLPDPVEVLTLGALIRVIRAMKACGCGWRPGSTLQ